MATPPYGFSAVWLLRLLAASSVPLQEAPSPKLLIYTEVFRWSSLKTQDAAKTSPCMHVLVQTPEEDCVQDVLDRFFVETAVQDRFVRISVVQKVPCLWHHTGSDVHFLTHPTLYGPDVQVKFIHPYCKHVWYKYICWKNQWQCLFFSPTSWVQVYMLSPASAIYPEVLTRGDTFLNLVTYYIDFKIPEACYNVQWISKVCYILKIRWGISSGLKQTPHRCI